MRVVILNQFFYPDHSATSQLMTELAESLVERGVAVTALAGRGLYNGSKESLPAQETHKGVRIVRAWSTGFGKRSTPGRVADYLSFYLGAIWSLLRLPQHDIVMALTTPPLIGLVALLIGRLRGMRIIALVQDIYPDVAVALGALRADVPTTRLFDWLNRLVLSRSDRVIVLGECMRSRVLEKIGVEASDRIDVIHNWADGALIESGQSRAQNPFALEHELHQRFVVMFSGNFGLVNEFGTVLEAARVLRERTDIVFLFLGDGVKRVELEQYVERHQLTNIRLFPYQSRAMLPHSLAAGSVQLVTLAEGLAGLSVPSKTYGILAAGKPILFVGDAKSGVAELICQHECGAVIPSGDSVRLAAVLEEWAGDNDKVEAMGVAARQLFEARFDRPQAVTSYLQTFRHCLNLSPDSNQTSNPVVARRSVS